MAPAASPASSEKLKSIKDLPLYPDPNIHSNDGYKFVEQEPLPLENKIRQLRNGYREFLEKQLPRYDRVDKTVATVLKTISDTKQYLKRDEASNLPKAAAITVGGMTGFVVSLRRYGAFRKVLYPALGLAATAAFCYPIETIDFVQIGIAHAQRTWDDFSQSPEPDNAKSKE